MNLTVPFEAYPWNSDSKVQWSITGEQEEEDDDEDFGDNNQQFQFFLKRIGNSNFETTLCKPHRNRFSTFLIHMYFFNSLV